MGGGGGEITAQGHALPQKGADDNVLRRVATGESVHLGAQTPVVRSRGSVDTMVPVAGGMPMGTFRWTRALTQPIPAMFSRSLDLD